MHEVYGCKNNLKALPFPPPPPSTLILRIFADFVCAKYSNFLNIFPPWLLSSGYEGYSFNFANIIQRSTLHWTRRVSVQRGPPPPHPINLGIQGVSPHLRGFEWNLYYHFLEASKIKKNYKKKPRNKLWKNIWLKTEMRMLHLAVRELKSSFFSA